jgi:hypothetical protein
MTDIARSLLVSWRVGNFLLCWGPKRSPMDGRDDNAQGLPHCTSSCLPLQPLGLLSAYTKWVLSCGCHCQHLFKQNRSVNTEMSLKGGGRCGRGWSLLLHFVASVLPTVSFSLRTFLHRVGGFTKGTLCKAPYAQKEVTAYWHFKITITMDAAGSSKTFRFLCRQYGVIT